MKLTSGEYPKIDGSTANIPLAIALRQAVTGCDKAEAEAKTEFTKTSNAYMALVQESEYAPDLIIAYAPPKVAQDELNQSKIKIIKTPIGRDALVFITNNANPVNHLSTEQIKDIYSGKITNWKTVGGQDKKIEAFQRPEDSGSQGLMRSLVMKDVNMMNAPKGYYPAAMGGLIDALMEYDNSANSIGYSVYYYASEMYEKPGLKFISVDGVKPEKKTIQDKTYPYLNDFYVCIRENTPKNSPTYRLYAFLTGQEGAAFINKQGYVSVN
ncbi:MAG: hypothetical protein BGN88_13585 [Clostridiales bacterium 43-6]|nr:MAG: hypothetical protein BGN88_13585 [Clostridiales bacterium 43-6]